MLVIAIRSRCFRAISIHEPSLPDGKMQQVCCRTFAADDAKIEDHQDSNIEQVKPSNEEVSWQHDTRRPSIAGSSCAIRNVLSLPQLTSALRCSNREGFYAIARTSRCWMDLQSPTVIQQYFRNATLSATTCFVYMVRCGPPKHTTKQTIR